MPNPMRIVPNDHGVLNLPAYAILDNMLNVPERGYRSFEEINRLFSIVQQETFMFNLSIEENIRIGKPDADIAEVIAAAKKSKYP